MTTPQKNTLSHHDIIEVFDRFFDPAPEKFLCISVMDQCMNFFYSDKNMFPVSPTALHDENRVYFYKKYLISSAEKGVGNIMESEKTPTGMHRIRHKIGDGVPYAGRFVERVFTGEIVPVIKTRKRGKEDFIITRIYWLEGLEEGINKGGQVDTYERYIYIHGTNEEGRIGTPASHGCIRIKNNDALELFDLVDTVTPVWITPYSFKV